MNMTFTNFLEPLFVGDHFRSSHPGWGEGVMVCEITAIHKNLDIKHEVRGSKYTYPTTTLCSAMGNTKMLRLLKKEYNP